MISLEALLEPSAAKLSLWPTDSKSDHACCYHVGMSNMNPDLDYSNLALSLRFAIRQSLKDVYTCMPGVVQQYDPHTRRAVVRGALRIVTTDGREIERVAIRNVPVVFPSGGGFALTFPLRPGDPVLLVYSQRGLSEFKRTLDVSAPDVDGFFSEKDAIAIPGFGPHGPETAGIHVTADGVVTIEAADVLFKRAGSDDDPRSIT